MFDYRGGCSKAIESELRLHDAEGVKTPVAAMRYHQKFKTPVT